METWQVILWILVFAVLGAILYIWGLRKSMTQQQDLMRILYQRGANKVLKMLKKQPVMTLGEIEHAVKNVTAAEFYSKKRAVVSDSKEFTKALVEQMISMQLLEEQPKGTYRAGKRKK